VEIAAIVEIRRIPDSGFSGSIAGILSFTLRRRRIPSLITLDSQEELLRESCGVCMNLEF
jgi:hypothetical protein